MEERESCQLGGPAQPENLWSWGSCSKALINLRHSGVLIASVLLAVCLHPLYRRARYNERITTKVSWDMWGFGFIMVQLLIGRCTTQLSNFEKAPPDAVMKKKLYIHDDRVLAHFNM